MAIHQETLNHNHTRSNHLTLDFCASMPAWTTSNFTEKWQANYEDFPFWMASTASVSVILFGVFMIFRRRYTMASTVQEEHQYNNRIHKQRRRRKEDFMKRAGGDYGYSSSPAGFIDNWRKDEFPNLIGPLPLSSGMDEAAREPENLSNHEVYLDYAGSALPSRSLLNAIHEDAISSSSILGNPHSSGPAASRTLRLIEQAKKEVLDHFQGHPGRFAALTSTTPSTKEDDNLFHPGYELIFTSGTTDALRIVSEHFPWSDGSNNNGHKSLLLYPHNAHTSVVGMRGPALAHGGNFLCKQLDDIMQLADEDISVEETLTRWGNEIAGSQTIRDRGDKQESTTATSTSRNLLVLPAECNFGGDRPEAAKLMRRLRRLNREGGGGTWSTMLDLAKAACTGPINLRELDPDFACVSFYKMFGAPTGVGALFVRRTAVNLLLPTMDTKQSIHRYFGGGSVDVVLSGKDFAIGRNFGQSSSSGSSDISRPSSLASLTQGTVHFRGIASLPHGFLELHRLGGMEQIQRHTHALAQELVQRLKSLRHSNNRPVVDIYGAWGQPPNGKQPGPVVAFNIRRQDGAVVGYNEVAKLGALNQPPLQLRTGCFCNPGACQQALNMSDDEIVENYMTSGHVCGDTVDTVNGMPTGLCRVSFGKDSLYDDLDELVVFLEKHFVTTERVVMHRKSPTTSKNVPTQAVLSEMFLYPIKSCACQHVKRWKMELPSGRLQYDREFALVDSFGTALRLQRFPKMGHIQPRVDPAQGTLIVSAPGMPDLVLGLHRDDDESTGVATSRTQMQSVVSVCGNKCSGKLWGDLDTSEWFSSYLGVQCWLARYDGGGFYTRSRSDKPSFSSTKNSIPPCIPITSNNRHAFSNEKPLLLISQYAVDQLNLTLRRQHQPSVSAKHFRPNLVVECCGDDNEYSHVGCHPEDSWESIAIQQGVDSTSDSTSDCDSGTTNMIQLSVCGLCARCAMVDVDPTTGTKGKTLRALADYRRNGGDIHFGIFLQGTTTSTSDGVDDDNKVPRAVWLDEGCTLLCQ